MDEDAQDARQNDEAAGKMLKIDAHLPRALLSCREGRGVFGCQIAWPGKARRVLGTRPSIIGECLQDSIKRD